MTIGNLFINDLQNNPNARIIVKGLPELVIGFLVSDVEIGGSANFQSDSGFRLNDLINKISRFTGKFDSNLGGFRINNIQESILHWMGSENFSISLDLIFIAIKPDDDVRNYIRILAQGIYATVTSAKDIPGADKLYGTKLFGTDLGALIPSENIASVSKAPNSYNGINPEGATGVLSLYIGKWFKATDIFVLNNFRFRISKECISSGLPLYAVGSIQLTAFKAIEPNDIKGWLSGNAIPVM